MPAEQQLNAQSSVSLSNLSGVSGNSMVDRNPNTKYNDSYQLIPVKNSSDARIVKSYLDDLLSDGFNGGFQLNPSSTAWVFVSSADENIIYERPYLKEGNVWFNVKPKPRTAKTNLSVWLFYMPAGQDFRVHFNGSDKSAEMSPATLLNDRFKKGSKKETTAGVFRIISTGEYFDDTMLLISAQGTKKQTVFGSVSYLSNIAAKKGTMFGAEYLSLSKVKRSYNFKFIHPPFTSGPGKGKTEFMVSKKCSFNQKDNFIWKFTENYELVPGTWTLQILDGGVVIYQKKFTITIARPVMQAAAHSAEQNQAGGGISANSSQSAAVQAANHNSATAMQAVADRDPLKIVLTKEQSAQVSGSKENKVTVPLTEWQSATIRKKFPELKKKTMTITRTGGAAASAATGPATTTVVTGLDSQGGATATVSGVEDNKSHIQNKSGN
jgi:hypothetical protein